MILKRNSSRSAMGDQRLDLLLACDPGVPTPIGAYLRARLKATAFASPSEGPQILNIARKFAFFVISEKLRNRIRSRPRDQVKGTEKPSRKFP